jgi:Protein of unknown function (DUF3179)
MRLNGAGNVIAVWPAAVQSPAMKRYGWLALFVACAATLAVVFAPAALIQPFAAQTVSGVSWSYALRQAAPVVSAGGAAVVLLALVTGWRRARWPGRTLLIALTTIMLATAWFARQNHFEWMFRPVHDVRFTSIEKTTGVVPHELVIAVGEGSDAMAFPIRRIGYHHVVNTTLGREPIVATY